MTDMSEQQHTEYLKRKLETADAEIARLENIVAIQQKQIERLMNARDAEKTRADELEARIAAALT